MGDVISSICYILFCYCSEAKRCARYHYEFRTIRSKANKHRVFDLCEVFVKCETLHIFPVLDDHSNVIINVFRHRLRTVIVVFAHDHNNCPEKSVFASIYSLIFFAWSFPTSSSINNLCRDRSVSILNRNLLSLYFLLLLLYTRPVKYAMNGGDSFMHSTMVIDKIAIRSNCTLDFNIIYLRPCFGRELLSAIIIIIIFR